MHDTFASDKERFQNWLNETDIRSYARLEQILGLKPGAVKMSIYQASRRSAPFPERYLGLVRLFDYLKSEQKV